MKNIPNFIEKGPESDQAVAKLKELLRKASSVIELKFFRHGQKENDKEKSDFDIALTEAGARQAAEKSKTKNIKQALAFGSPRDRAQQTAGLVMAGRYDEINGNESLSELKQKLDKDLKVGSKIGVDKRLDFQIDVNREYDQKLMAAFKKGEFLPFLFNDSDRLAEESGGKEGLTSYSGTASEVAKIIEKYVKISPRWDKLVADGKKDYSKTLERIFASHQGVLETFLAKVIELTKGIAERKKFQQALNNTGFDFVEGYQVEIITKGAAEPVIFINYTKEKDGSKIYNFTEEIPLDMLEKIAKG